ncbi:hypothetical protein ScoT_15970 [Streptomyces albidoflavus]|uniref:Secreted protein n=1 Tax=Streptomyces albidoflavus TaxID=1886 RepID=A0AA37FE76_9ACTN|nr:hypothetical protein ScoT_15970 [Streptomyces albidoflavus]
MFAVLYVLASSPVPSAAACNTCRISPVARDTTVPTAISSDDRASPPPALFARPSAVRARTAESAPCVMRST